MFRNDDWLGVRITTMSFQSSDQAKTYVVNVTSLHRTHEESLRWLNDLRGYLSRADDDQSRQTWQEQIESTETWLASTEYKEGNHPQSIDEHVLELIEWRALQHAFQLVDTQRKPFDDYVFYQQWLIGSVYAAYSILGKLTGTGKQETSLIKVWRIVEPWIKRDRACTPAELKCISARINGPEPQFTNRYSKAILFRNSVIAHNEKSISIAWGEIDKDIQTLARIWSLLVSWSSLGIFAPFRSGRHAFAGLESNYTSEELTQLLKKRQEYIDQSIKWMTSFLHSGAPDSGRGPLATIDLKPELY